MIEFKKNKYSKLVTRGLILLPVMLVLHFIFIVLSPIQFTVSLINSIMLFLIVICFLFLLLCLLWSIKFSHRMNVDDNIHIIMTLIMLALYIIPITLTLMFCMIQRDDTEFYVNRYNKNIKIEKMSYDEGAWGNGEGGKMVRVYYFFPLLRYVSKIDTNKINKKDWIRVKYDYINGKFQKIVG